MVSFRYHIVTIVAVFVALSVGILMGSTVLDPGLVNDLQNRTHELAQQLSRQRATVADQQKQLQNYAGFANAVLPALVSGDLSGNDVVIVTQQNADLPDLRTLREVLAGPQGAGATLEGVVVVNDAMALTEAGGRQGTAKILGMSPAESRTRLMAAAARALADRLASGPAGVGATDMLQSLVDQKLVLVQDASVAPAAIGGPGVSVVVLASTSATPALDPSHFFVPFIDSLVQRGTETAAVGPTLSASSFIPDVRADDRIDGKIVTVDTIDLVYGQVALVWGLQGLRAGESGGDYGLQCGSCALLPLPSPQPSSGP
jgi:hypothetical protein